MLAKYENKTIEPGMTTFLGEVPFSGDFDSIFAVASVPGPGMGGTRVRTYDIVACIGPGMAPGTVGLGAKNVSSTTPFTGTIVFAS